MLTIKIQQIYNLELGDIIETDNRNYYLIVKGVSGKILLIDVVEFETFGLFDSLDMVSNVVKIKKVYKNNRLILEE